MLNPEQLHTAGRKLCQLRGQDPDEIVEQELPSIGLEYCFRTVTRAILAADEIEAHLTRIAQLNEAIASVKP
jgi:hypothetical protein